MADSDSEDEALFVGVNLPPPQVHFCQPAAQDIVLDSDIYKVALEILSGKRFGCPSLGVLRSHLDSFVGQPTTAFFNVGSVLGTRFNNFKKGLTSLYKSASAKKDVWTKLFLAPRLSLLLSLRHLREEEKKGQASAARGKPTALAKAFVDLNNMFQPCYQAYRTNEESESNKKFRTPSLQLHKSNARPHEHFQWTASARIKSPCPVCKHVSTTLFQLPGGGDDDPMGAERVAAAAAISASADTGCFCFRINCHGNLDGSGCYLCEAKARDNVPPNTNTPGVCKWGCPVCACHCSCTFSEKNRMTIALGWNKSKERESKKTAREPPVAAEITLMSRIISHVGNAGGMMVNGGMTYSGNNHYDFVASSSEEEEDDGDNDNDVVYQKKRQGGTKTNAALSAASLDILNSGKNIYYCCNFVLSC